MKKLKFKTNSRHISQLGRELVTDFVTALVELIKNSYDADAYGVKIRLENPNTPQSRIILVDTGSGMTQLDFENKWMVIGTNNKVSHPFSPKGRKKSGKKGIGRFSVERLAEKVEIYSFPKEENPFKVSINWNNFEDINIDALIQRISILKNHKDAAAAKFICNQIEYFLLNKQVEESDKECVLHTFSSNFDYSCFYDFDNLKRLETEVLPVLKKYEDMQQLIGDVESSLELVNIEDSPLVFEELNSLYEKYNLTSIRTGIVLVMEGLRDEWKQKDVDKLQKELRMLVAPDFIEKDPFQVELVAPTFKIEDMVLVNDILQLCYAKISAKIYDDATKLLITYTDKEGKEDSLKEEYDQPLLCGDVSAEIYFFLRDSHNLTNPGAGYNFRFAQRILDTYCGIKIYRDNFRVKPYGDIGNDWLFLDQKKVKDTHGYLVGNNQVIGVVKISDVTNPLLIDATNREGIIENESYTQLKDFLTKCTNLISDIRRAVYLQAQEETKKIETQKIQLDAKLEAVKQQLQGDSLVGEIQAITTASKEKLSSESLKKLLEIVAEDAKRKQTNFEQVQQEYEQHYQNAKKAYQDKIQYQESELNLYKNLASLGMLTGSFGHETSDIVSRIQASIKLMEIYLGSDESREPVNETLQVIKRDFTRIEAYSDLIINFLKKRKQQKTADLNLGVVLSEICALYQSIVSSYRIQLQVSCKDQIVYPMKQIDLESIVINMITNAFEEVKGKSSRIIRITIKEDASHVIMMFEDSGNGVQTGKEKSIFRAFETTKEDGIGLGLNIVKDIVDNYSGEISVRQSESLNGASFVVSIPKGD